MSEAKSLSIEDKKQIAKFERGVRKIYDQLKRPDGSCDMSFRDFRSEFISLGNPDKIRSDMESIALQQKIKQSAISLN